MSKTLPKNCPDCGGKVNSSYSPAYQEYAGASVQGGYTYVECIGCGWNDIIDEDLSDFNFQENRRGW